MGEDTSDPLDQLLLAVKSVNEIDKSVELNQNEDEFFLAKIAADDLKPQGKLKLKKTKVVKKDESVVHTGDTDSSDDECNRDYQNSKYTKYGQEIRRFLSLNSKESKPESAPSWKQKQGLISDVVKLEEYITDPFFGIRISKPLISSAGLRARMTNRVSVPMKQIKNFVKNVNADQNWVVAGAIVQKSHARTSQTGSQYAIWTLSDLQGDLLTVSLFLFRKSFTELWKLSVGTVVGVLNPNVLENREGAKTQATLSIDNPQRVLILGQAKDYGICKSKKSNGEPCTSFVNTSRCSYCIFHVKKEYKMCSARAELQSKFSGGGLQALRNKVLGKNEVFYAGKSYTAVPVKKSKKLVEKDNKRLMALNQKGIVTFSPPQPKEKAADSLDVPRNQRFKDLLMLEKLCGKKTTSNDKITSEKSKNNQTEATTSKNRTKKPKNILEPEIVKKLTLNLNSLTKTDILAEKLNKKFPNSDKITLEESRNYPLNAIDKLKYKNKLINDESSSNVNKRLFNKNILELEDEPALKLNSSTNTDVLAEELNKKFPNSDEITLEESRSYALNAIAKLKSKNKLINDASSSNTNKRLSNKNILELEDEPILKLNSSAKIDVLGEELNKKYSDSDKITLEESRNNALSVIAKLKSRNSQVKKIDNENSTKDYTNNNLENKQNKEELANERKENSNLFMDLDIDRSKLKMLKAPSEVQPKLSHNGNFLVDLNVPVNKQINRTKIKALQWVQKNGPIKKDNPTGLKKSGVKRFLQESEDPATKRSKLEEEAQFSERFRKMIEMKSKHADLLEQHDQNQQEKYFHKLEMREKMEEKMMTTYKVQCKAVRCLQCKYTSFSAAEKCKTDKHPLKVFDAMKRFFKCADCGNRTVALDICPLVACKQCGSSKWERTTMMKEKIATTIEGLSIRGGEQKFINSVQTNANINLLISED